MDPPGGEANDMFRFELEGYDKERYGLDFDRIGVHPCDYSFVSTFNIKFLGGENFSKTNDEIEGSGEYIINESAMKRLGFSKPSEIIGKRFKLIFIPEIVIPEGKIIGVVEDFHLSSIKKKVEPLVLFKRKYLFLQTFTVSYHKGMKKTAMNDIKTVWEKLFSAYPMYFEDIDNIYRSVYKTELLQQKLLAIFTIVALVISAQSDMESFQ